MYALNFNLWIIKTCVRDIYSDSLFYTDTWIIQKLSNVPLVSLECPSYTEYMKLKVTHQYVQLQILLLIQTQFPGLGYPVWQ